MSDTDPLLTSIPAQARTLRRALVGYDGSDASATAAAFGLWLAGKAGVQTTLVHVCADPKPSIPASALATASEHLAAEESDWRRQLDNLTAYGSDRAPVDCWVKRGHPAGALIDAATATEADVILIGSSGVGTLRGELLGSVSSQLVEHAPCSVMVFREGYPASPAHLRSVLVGLDGSRGSLDALAMAQELAAPLEARLVLCAAYPAGVAFAPPTSELRDEPRVHARSVVDAARRTVPGKPEVIEELGEGRARDVLLRACEHHAPAVLVLGSRGLRGFKRLLLGSTSRWLANHAPCPVLIARRRSSP